MKRQLIVSLSLLLIMPGVFFYQPSTSADAASSPDGLAFALTSDIAAQQGEPVEHDKDVPWVPILILALIVPSAALLVPSFFMAKRESEGSGPPG